MERRQVIRKISFCLFLLAVWSCPSAQDSVSTDAPAAQEPPVFESVSDSQRDFASLRRDVESSVATLDELRSQRDAASGDQKTKLAAQVDAVYEHLSRLRREVAEFALKNDAAETQRRLEIQRQQQSLIRQNSDIQRRMIEQQQRLAHQQEQQRRISRMTR